jgi:hypothetical protein
MWGRYSPTLNARSITEEHPHACGEDFTNNIGTNRNRTEHPHACGEDTSMVCDLARFDKFYPSYVSKKMTKLLTRGTPTA